MRSLDGTRVDSGAVGVISPVHRMFVAEQVALDCDMPCCLKCLYASSTTGNCGRKVFSKQRRRVLSMCQEFVMRHRRDVVWGVCGDVD